MAERFISKEATRRVEIGGVIAGIIGLITGIAALEIGGLAAAGGAAVYDIYEARKEKKAGK
jgi:hypothetical protein